jgi:hypothetical protein
MRATWSTDPPGGNTEMIFTGFVGHAACGYAAGEARERRAQANATRQARGFDMEDLRDDLGSDLG